MILSFSVRERRTTMNSARVIVPEQNCLNSDTDAALVTHCVSALIASIKLSALATVSNLDPRSFCGGCGTTALLLPSTTARRPLRLLSRWSFCAEAAGGAALCCSVESAEALEVVPPFRGFLAATTGAGTGGTVYGIFFGGC